MEPTSDELINLWKPSGLLDKSPRNIQFLISIHLERARKILLQENFYNKRFNIFLFPIIARIIRDKNINTIPLRTLFQELNSKIEEAETNGEFKYTDMNLPHPNNIDEEVVFVKNFISSYKS